MIALALIVFVLAVLLALVEIEIEGKYGWAEKTQTWYRKPGFFGNTFLSGKPITGYFIFLNLFILIFFHISFFLGLAWTLSSELYTLSLWFAFLPLWDFLWFVLNPNYTLKNFKKDKVWWFNRSDWLFSIFPAEYLYSWLISLVFAFIAGMLVEQLITLSCFVILTIITCIVAKNYHKFYINMRKRDDRKKVGIFHKKLS